MASQTAARNAPQYEGSPLPSYTKAPVGAAVVIWPGALVQMVGGYAKPAAAGQAGPMLGVSDDTYDNSGTNSTGFPVYGNGTAGSIVASKIKPGVFPFANSSGGDAIALGNVGQPCFAVDDHTVALTDGGGTRPFAGIIWDYDASIPGSPGPVWVLCGPFVTPGVGQGGAAPVLGSIISLPVQLAAVAAGSIIGAFTPGFAGKILSAQFAVTTPSATAGRAATLQPEITGVATTGGAVGLTTANTNAEGDVVAGSAITGANEFGPADTLSVVASGVTAFAEGQGVLLLSLVAA